jgi:hypothetical protein
MNKFNCEIAKKVPLESIMAHLGIACERKKGDDIWYKSPFCIPQKTGSFKVNIVINKWFDFALGEGGDTIKLVALINKCNTSKALEYIRGLNYDLFSFQQLIGTIQSAKMEILEIAEIKSENIKKYLFNRGLHGQEIYDYCNEITYSNKGRMYKSLGFKNRIGGFELRDEGFKSCFGKKDITFYDFGQQNLSVFEGFIDFLSYLMLPEFEIKEANYLIMNSLSMIPRIDEIIKNHEKCYYFLDNDLAGKSAFESLKSRFEHQIDKSGFYAAHKDLNDFLIFKNTQSHE